MFVRFAALSVMVIAGALLLVAPDGRDGHAPERAPRAESAVALLGETWTLAAPDTVAPDAAPRSSASVSPRPARRPDAFVVQQDAAPARRADLLMPQRRPVGLSAPLPPAQVALDADPRAAALEAEPVRWIVRDQGTGAVLAELPLSEALALMQARSLRRP